ncbi:MAG: hypothetical protein WCR21_11095 [Bacteroidota bacterium]
MKKVYSLFFTVAVAALFTFSACNKDKKAFRNEDGSSTVDNRTAQSENDAAVSDVNDVLGNQGSLRGKGTEASGTTGVLGNICGMSLDTASMKAGSVKLNYNGTTCNNRTRTGSIVLSIVDYALGKRWKTKGAVLKVEFQAYKIKRASDGKSIQFDGVQYITNESGGTWWELFFLKTQSNLVHTISSSNLNATFEDGKTAIYNINRKITYSYPSNIVTCMAEGIGSSEGLNNLENFGTTRDGAAFTSQVSTPIIWNLTCGAGAPIQGEVNVKVAAKAFELKCLFGVDNSGNSVTVAANSCAYGWKLEWTYKGETKKKIIGYN